MVFTRSTNDGRAYLRHNFIVSVDPYAAQSLNAVDTSVALFLPPPWGQCAPNRGLVPLVDIHHVRFVSSIQESLHMASPGLKGGLPLFEELVPLVNRRHA